MDPNRTLPGSVEPTRYNLVIGCKCHVHNTHAKMATSKKRKTLGIILFSDGGLMACVVYVLHTTAY